MATAITTELIKQLRESTGISVMQCQRALEEAQGNMQKALAILKKTSSDIAMKKMSREAKDGRVCIKTNSEKAVLISLHCETDFVSRNADFVNLLLKLGDIALAEGIEKMKATSKAMIDSVVQKTGENIQLGENYEVAGDVLGNYVHNNKIGVIVSLAGGNSELAKDVAMHITAMKSDYTSPVDVLDQSFIKNMEETVGQLLEKNHTKIKEVKVYSI